jgi:ankyrin repeat protein
MMLASGCVLGLVGREVRQAKRREQAANDLAKAASKVEIEYVNFWGSNVEKPPPQWQRRFLGEHFFQHVTGVIVASADQLDPDGRELAELRHLRSFIYSAYRREDSERQLAGLRPLRRLEKVHLHGVTDAGLVCLSPENPLLELNLGGTCVTDAGLAHIARFKTLESLDLSSTLITDEGIGRLLKLPRLKSLSMRRVQVSEEGLRRLAGCPSLESLDLGWLPVSAATFGEISRFPHLRRLSLGSGASVSIFDAQSLQDSASQERAAAILEPPNVFWAIHRHHAPRNTPYLRWLLERGADPNNPPGGQTPLAILAGRGHREPIEVLLEFGADLNPARTDETPLAAAIGRGHLDLARFLLERGAKPECDEQLTPLLAACYGRNDAAMRLLIAHGADVNRADAYGRRPLHVAAFNPRLVQLLLEAGADPNAPDSEGNTPLHRAAEGGALESARLLLARGSDPSLQNKQGDTPQAIAAMLLERGGYSSQELVDTLAPAAP